MRTERPKAPHRAHLGEAFTLWRLERRLLTIGGVVGRFTALGPARRAPELSIAGTVRRVRGRRGEFHGGGGTGPLAGRTGTALKFSVRGAGGASARRAVVK